VHIDLFEIWAQATIPVKVVILTMMLMGVGSLYVAIERTFSLGRARTQSRALAAALGAAFQKGDAAAALSIAQQEEYKHAYLARLLKSGLKEWVNRPDAHGIEAAERAIQRSNIDEDANLRRGFGILATTGATCPFVGLVGTIFGIIGAFQAMADGGGDLDKLLVPIAEALIATAIGIAVAIVGVWLFNWFNAKVTSIANDMSTSEIELMDWFHKQILKSEDEGAEPATSA
jgi:biopolymer transport protein ExbB